MMKNVNTSLQREMHQCGYDYDVMFDWHICDIWIAEWLKHFLM